MPGPADRLAVPGEVPGEDVPGELLQDEFGDVAAGVAAHVQDQRGLVEFAPQVPVELCPAGAAEVRDVQVAAPAVAELPYQGAASGDPVLVADGPFVGERGDGDPPEGPVRAAAQGQFDGGAAGAGQQRQRAAHRVDGPAADLDELVSVAHALGGQRGAGARVGGLAGQHPVDQPASLGGAVGVGAEQAERLLGERGPLGAAGRGDVGVRGAQFAEEFAQQVGEVVG